MTTVETWNQSWNEVTLHVKVLLCLDRLDKVLLHRRFWRKNHNVRKEWGSLGEGGLSLQDQKKERSLLYYFWDETTKHEE